MPPLSPAGSTGSPPSNARSPTPNGSTNSAPSKRRAKAESQRRVTCRPAPDAMAQLTILGPVAQIVACYAALRKAADAGVATGDGRSHGQLMADTGVERLTGQATATAVPVHINLIMTDQTLLGEGPDSDH